jgi:hypothetical protein
MYSNTTMYFFFALVATSFGHYGLRQANVIQHFSSCDLRQFRLHINHLKTKSNLLYIRNQSVPRCKHFPPRL